MGGHVEECEDCGQQQIVYNSCRNRHCPKCGSIDREKWLLAREADLLPVRYFHVVFTLPEALNNLCLHYPQDMYKILFHVVWDVLKTFGKDKKWIGCQLGMTCLLHTWGQNLSLHPHLHCIVPAGGITNKAKWKHSRNRGKFLFRVEHLSNVYRARFVASLRDWAKEKKIHIQQQLFDKLFEKDWVVDARQPFGGPKQVLKYLGRYTNRIAITNYRILSIKDGIVTFSYKDYADNEKIKSMPLRGEEFLRRFIMHIFPYRFVRIRHYGFLSSRNKSKLLVVARHSLKAKPPCYKELSWHEIVELRWGIKPLVCHKCKGKMSITQTIQQQRAPPVWYDIKPNTKFYQQKQTA